MTTHTPLSDPAQIAAEIEFLTRHCRGPEPVKETLRAWVRDFARAHWRASEMTRLKQILHGLVVISHANAAFTLDSDHKASGATPASVIIDTGGYLTARILIIAVLDTADIDDDCRADLARYVASTIKCQSDQIFALIYRAVER